MYKNPRSLSTSGRYSRPCPARWSGALSSLGEASGVFTSTVYGSEPAGLAINLRVLPTCEMCVYIRICMHILVCIAHTSEGRTSMRTYSHISRVCGFPHEYTSHIREYTPTHAYIRARYQNCIAQQKECCIARARVCWISRVHVRATCVCEVCIPSFKMVYNFFIEFWMHSKEFCIYIFKNRSGSNTVKLKNYLMDIGDADFEMCKMCIDKWTNIITLETIIAFLVELVKCYL